MPVLDKIRPPFRLLCLLLCFVITLTSHVYAREKNNINIAVVLSKDTPPYHAFSEKLQKTLTATQIQKVKFHTIDSDINDSISTLYVSGNAPDFIVAAGAHASKKILTSDNSIPTIFSLIPSSYYKNRIQNSPYCKRGKYCSAVYLDQPVERQFSIIKKGLPDAKHLGIILGPSSKNIKNEILRASKKYGINVILESAKTDENLIVLVDHLARSSDALLAIPDHDVYNRKTAKGILLNSYKNHIPFVAYSHSFVRAGALFSIYSTPEQIGEQTGRMLMEMLTHSKNTLPEPEFPDAYKVEINPAVLRSLRSRIHFNDSILDKQ